MKINCKESAIRSSELRDRQLKGIRKLELWYHILICRFCRIYHKQIKMLGKLSRMMGETSSGLTGPCEEMSDVQLSESAKSRIKSNLMSR